MSDEENAKSAKLFLGGLSWDTTEGEGHPATRGDGGRPGPGGSRLGPPQGLQVRVR